MSAYGLQSGKACSCLVDAWARCGKAAKAAEVLEALEAEAKPLDRYAHTAAISALADARQLERAQELLRPDADAAAAWPLAELSRATA